MIRQLSDTDAVTVEVIKDNTKIIAGIMYFDSELQIETVLEKWNGCYYTLKILESQLRQTPTPDQPSGMTG
jgi:hypothetical protein